VPDSSGDLSDSSKSAITGPCGFKAVTVRMAAYVSIRQHTSAYVSKRQHASATWRLKAVTVRIATIASDTISPARSSTCIRQHTSAYVSIRQQKAVTVRIATIAIASDTISPVRSSTLLDALLAASLRPHTQVA
jgi:hypothetical protein